MTQAPFTAHALEALSPELLRAAQWLQAHPHAAAMQSMRECARRSGLSPATFTRLARALGHEGFEGLKARFQQAVAPDEGYAAKARALQASARRKDGWLEALNEVQHANAASVAGLNAREELEAAAGMLLGARKVAFLGLRASHGIAFHLHYTYALLAGNGLLLQDLGGTLADQVARLGRGDVLAAVSLSPYTRQTVQAAGLAAEQGASVLALTDGASSPLAAVATRTLVFRSQTASYFQSMVGALALAEALAAAVAVRGGRRAVAHLQSVQRQLDAQGAYWKKRGRAAATLTQGN